MTPFVADATRLVLLTLIPALKRRAKVIPTLRVENEVTLPFALCNLP